MMNEWVEMSVFESCRHRLHKVSILSFSFLMTVFLLVCRLILTFCLRCDRFSVHVGAAKAKFDFHTKHISIAGINMTSWNKYTSYAKNSCR